MTSLRSLLLRCGLALWLAAVAGQAAAVTPRPDAPARPGALLRVQGDVGPAGAAAAARAATGGRVLGVIARTAGGRTVYRVKVLLPGGRVRTVTVDGPTGQVQG